MDDLDAEGMTNFIRTARRARNFPLSKDTSPQELLTHLNLLADGRPTIAAVLLFGTHPQRFLLSAEVKCAHFHGIEVAKPIHSYQVYKGTAFALVDQAVDFRSNTCGVGINEIEFMGSSSYKNSRLDKLFKEPLNDFQYCAMGKN